MLIVLEGLDGAGKSTQLKMVTSYFASLGRKVDYLHFPRYSAPLYGELIAKFLRGDFGAIDQVHPQLVALLFAEDRRDAAGLLRSWTDQGHVVVLDATSIPTSPSSAPSSPTRRKRPNCATGSSTWNTSASAFPARRSTSSSTSP